LYNVKQQYGGCMNSAFIFRFYVDNQWTSRARRVKFGMAAYHNDAHKFCMKYCLQINSYKHGDGMTLRDHVQQI
jgi:hypothetical protein